LAIVAGGIRRRIGNWRLTPAQDLVAFPDAANVDRLRLLLALLLCGVGIAFFRQAAWNELAAIAVTAVALLAGLWVGFHRLGLRVMGTLSPGWARGAATALLLFAVLPPGLPLWLLAALVLLALVVEGLLRHTLTPLAVSGVLLAWPVAWLWQARTAVPYLSPIDLHRLDEPIQLWRHFGLAVDPLRLYTGNVAGPLGATSLLAVTVAFLVLAYARRASWYYVLGFFASVAASTALTRQPLTVYLLSGPALFFAGLIGADTRGLPRSRSWHAGGGIAAGAMAAALLWRGLGWQAFAAGVSLAAVGLAALQLLGPAGASLPTAPTTPARGPITSVPMSARLVVELAAALLVAPVGWILVATDNALSGRQRRRLVGATVALFVLAAILSLLWIYSLRLPA
jgi:hypothetical protein